MKKVDYKILKQIRVDRKISLTRFACMLEISTSYLCMIENDQRDLSGDLINKILKVLPDLSLVEKHELNQVLDKDIEKAQKQVLNLITQFFYRVRQGIKDGLDELFDAIVNLIKKFREEDIVPEMAMFSKI